MAVEDVAAGLDLTGPVSHCQPLSPGRQVELRSASRGLYATGLAPSARSESRSGETAWCLASHTPPTAAQDARCSSSPTTVYGSR